MISSSTINMPPKASPMKKVGADGETSEMSKNEMMQIIES